MFKKFLTWPRRWGKPRLCGAHHLTGDTSQVWGDARQVWGDATFVVGNLTGLRGCLGGVWGDVSDVHGTIEYLHGCLTGFWGDLTDLHGDLCVLHIHPAWRRRGVHAADLAAVLNTAYLVELGVSHV
jgi:hypothetical protein